MLVLAFSLFMSMGDMAVFNIQCRLVVFAFLDLLTCGFTLCLNLRN